MPAIITNEFRVQNSDSIEDLISRENAYVFIGKSSEWADESMPDSVNNAADKRIQLYKDMMALKKITPANIISVVRRIDWQGGQVYDQYNDIVDLNNERNPATGNFYNHYVLTDEFNVYKCISNNRREPSQIKPTGTSTTNFQTSDGYVWKYMYTIRSADVFDFLTDDWMPCYTPRANDGSAQWLVQESAVQGTIDNIVVENNGVNYDPNNPPTVIIGGDGSGAAATVQVNIVTGEISRVDITNPGSGYTYATVSLANTGVGGGFEGRAVISPVGGHGRDARVELGCTHKMIKLDLDGNESGFFPTTVTYRQSGIILNPLSNTDGVSIRVTNSTLYNVNDEVIGQTSGASGSVHYIDRDTDTLYLNNVTGAFIQSELVQSETYNQTTVIAVNDNTRLPLTTNLASVTDFRPYSGQILYISNREKITRNEAQTEEVRMIMEY